jgi:glucose-1-phosphate thymidylyltransferase
LLDSGQTIDAIRLDGWRVNVGCLKDLDRAEELLDDSGEYAELYAIQSRG